MAHSSPSDHHDDHAAWNQFPAEEQQTLLNDDSEAWNGVTTILLTIVAIGLALSFITLWLSS
jgi:hypothetical protein